MAYASSMDVPGIFTRRVMDAALLLDAIDSGPDKMDPTTLQRSRRTGHDTVEALLGELLPSCGSRVPTQDDNEWQRHYLAGLKVAEGAVGRTLQGVVVGVPAELSVHELDPIVLSTWENTLEMLVDAGAQVCSVCLPSLKSAIPSYYMLACAEASSNLSRYDGIRYGHKRRWSQHDAAEDGDGPALTESEGNTSDVLHRRVAEFRGENFGPEVLRRILAGG